MFVLSALLLVQAPQLPQRQLVADLTITATGADDPQFIGAVLESQGQIFLADARSGAIYRYDVQGKPLPWLGGQGEGPGEFQMPGALGLRGDSIWVWDPMQHRMLLFDGAGRSVRTTTMTSATSGLGALLNDGTIVVIPGWSSSRARAGAPPTLPVLRFTSAGSLRDTLFRLEVELGQMQMDMGNGSSLVGAQPFSDFPILVGAFGGDGFVKVERRTTGAPEITVRRLGRDGRVRWVRRIPFVGSRVDRSVLDSVIARYTKSSDPRLPGVPEDVVRKAISIPVRSVQALSVASAPDGAIWVRRPTPVGVGAMFTVLAANGTPAFEVRLPPGGRLAGFGRGTIYVASLDPDELPVLTRYRLR